MKLKTIMQAKSVAKTYRLVSGVAHAVTFTVEEMKANGFTHIAVEADGAIFAWTGKHRPLAMRRGNADLDGWFSHLSEKHGMRDCCLGEMIGHLGYAPVNWHRMVWELK